jgi:hypothetical protein
MSRPCKIFLSSPKVLMYTKFLASMGLIVPLKSFSWIFKMSTVLLVLFVALTLISRASDFTSQESVAVARFSQKQNLHSQKLFQCWFVLSIGKWWLVVLWLCRRFLSSLKVLIFGFNDENDVKGIPLKTFSSIFKMSTVIWSLIWRLFKSQSSVQFFSD